MNFCTTCCRYFTAEFASESICKECEQKAYDRFHKAHPELEEVD